MRRSHLDRPSRRDRDPIEVLIRTRAGLNFTLTTDLGPLDLLGEIPGGRYDDLVADGLSSPELGPPVRCLSLERLIATKRAAGRTKDLVALSELEALLEERDRR